MSGPSMPKYRQIAADLRARIERGEYPPGSRLPTRPELAEMYDAAVGTVAQALSELRTEGWIETAQGAGIFALSPPPRRGPSGYRELEARVESLERWRQRLDQFARTAREGRADEPDGG